MNQSIVNHYREVIENKLKADPAAFQGNNGHDLLHWMIDDDCLDMFEVLQQVGCDLNASDKLGTPPLMHAVIRDKAACVKKLIDLGADPYAKNNTIIATAVASASEDLAIFLLELAPPRNDREEEILFH